MAKNLRQKYKAAKKQLQRITEERSYCNSAPIVVNSTPLRKFRTTRMFQYGDIERIPKTVLIDIAFDLAKYMVANNVIDIKESFDPYRGETYVVAELLVADRVNA